MSEVNRDIPKYYPDVSHTFSRYRRRQFQGFHVSSVDNPLVRDVVSDFADKQGCFSIKSEAAYNRSLAAQRIADADGDKKISKDELEVYNAFNDIYSKPIVGGVEFDPSELHNIKTVAKNDDGSYTVKYQKKNDVVSGTYCAQNSDARVKFSPSLFEPKDPSTLYQIVKNS